MLREFENGEEGKCNIYDYTDEHYFKEIYDIAQDYNDFFTHLIAGYRKAAFTNRTAGR
jgi:hypothetical protein